MQYLKDNLVWVTGPLGQSTTKYWVPLPTVDPDLKGKYLAWYIPKGLPSPDDKLLGEFCTLSEAKRACAIHADALLEGSNA